MENTCAILLAAGTPQQTGGASALSQVLFRPLIRWAFDNCQGAGIKRICIFAGADQEEISQGLPEGLSAAKEEDGALCAKAFLAGHQDTDVLIVPGDAPFLFPEILENALRFHRKQENAATMIAWAACWTRGEALLAALEKLPNGFSADSVWQTIRETGGRTGDYADLDSFAGMRAGTLRQLAEVNRAARDMVLDRLYEAGVDIPLADGVMIDPRAKIAAGAQILPGTIIKGETAIGAGSVIGPNSWLEDAVLGADCIINATYVLGAVLEDDVQIGPFCRVRPGSHISAGVRIGNFVEVKNANVGPGTKSAHLTYIGDADVGARVNFGCGVCIANYDGVRKHRTIIGDDCFIGCNTNLVAPVTLGDGAYTAAGTTVTQDVPPDALCIGRSRQTNLPDRAKEHQKHPRK
ncbi:MAG: NTP transferase domain-containing protein [Angelakisella sp.]|jgi:bifunctional UDP-N-acetylglucosamine pyrophosphorylase/glucosamine-1-phosphate N-acetyltransferase|nr:NTP transferase domain-containing protein [Angelakisella sp.]